MNLVMILVVVVEIKYLFLVLNSLLSSSQPSVGSLNPVDITLHPRLSNALCVLLINAQSRIVAHAMSAHCHIDS